MNEKLLREIADLIVAHPKKFEMRNAFTGLGAWGRFEHGDPRWSEDWHECGTAACIAGWAVALKEIEERLNKSAADIISATDDQVQESLVISADMPWGAVHHDAVELLQLDSHAAERLFYVIEWPSQFQEAMELARRHRDLQKQAEIARDRILYFISTGGTDSSRAAE